MLHESERVKEHGLGWARPLRFLVYGFLLATLVGCTSIHERYIEQHTIKNLTVVFLDEISLHERWKQLSGSDAVRFRPQMNNEVPLLNAVKGFYDFPSNTLYCPKWNFEVCGHELHHATLGHFHED